MLLSLRYLGQKCHEFIPVLSRLGSAKRQISGDVRRPPEFLHRRRRSRRQMRRSQGKGLPRPGKPHPNQLDVFASFVQHSLLSLSRCYDVTSVIITNVRRYHRHHHRYFSSLSSSSSLLSRLSSKLTESSSYFISFTVIAMSLHHRRNFLFVIVIEIPLHHLYFSESLSSLSLLIVVIDISLNHRHRYFSESSPSLFL